MFLSIFIFIILAKTSTRVVLSLALILGALAIVFCLALDLLKCNSLIEWNDHFDQTVHYFGRFWTVLDGKNWSKQVLSSFFHFVRKKQVLDGKNPTLIDGIYFQVYLLPRACSWMATEMAEVSNRVNFRSWAWRLTCPEKSGQRRRQYPMISGLVRKKRYRIQCPENIGPASTCCRWCPPQETSHPHPPHLQSGDIDKIRT